MRETEKLLKLNDLISTGKTASAKKYMANLFNLKSEEQANLGLFSSKAGQMVLGQIRLLGANPTEGERAFLQDISAGIEQGSAINEAILNDLLKIQKRQYERGKWFAGNRGATLDDYLLTEHDEFVPTSTIDGILEPAGPSQIKFMGFEQ